MSTLLFNAAFAFYAVSLFHSILGFMSKRDLLLRIAFASQTIGFALHTIFIIALGIEFQRFPLTNLRESLIFFAWAVSLCFQITHLRYGIKALGLFSLPLVTLFLLGTAFLKSHTPPDFLSSYWVYLHTTFLLLAYGMFFVTTVASVLYLFQQREIKSRNPKIFNSKLPSLLVMDEAFQKFLTWGFSFMTLGLLAGIIWAEREWLGGWQSDPKVISTVVTWLIYLALIFLRFSAGWRGKRAAIMSLVGFISVLFTFLGARMFFGGLHSF